MTTDPAAEPLAAPDSASGSAPAPGYFPRLLSAAAHVKHLASDAVLERFDLTGSGYSLLNRLAVEQAADETALVGASGQSPVAVHRELAALQSSGYAVCKDSGMWFVTPAGRHVIECAKLAEAEITLDAEDSQELRKALRALISSLGLEQSDGAGKKHP